jgi:hypothetical protein
VSSSDQRSRTVSTLLCLVVALGFRPSAEGSGEQDGSGGVGDADSTTEQIDGPTVLNELPEGPAYFLKDGMGTVTWTCTTWGFTP